MKFILSPETQIGAIKQKFNDEFPFLKIEFFTHLHPSDQLSLPSDMISSATELSKISAFRGKRVLNISELLTVKNFEDWFKNELNISVQVFRKSNQQWLQTSKTDEWTLKRQNDIGKEMSQAEQHQQIEENDYHEQL
jgi:hypothetical protein